MSATHDSQVINKPQSSSSIIPLNVDDNDNDNVDDDIDDNDIDDIDDDDNVVVVIDEPSLFDVVVAREATVLVDDNADEDFDVVLGVGLGVGLDVGLGVGLGVESTNDVVLGAGVGCGC